MTYKRLYDTTRYSHKAFAQDAFDEDAFEMKATYDSGTAGINNEVFGAVIYNQVNLDSNLYGVLPKVDARQTTGDVQSFRTAEDKATLNNPDEGATVGTASTTTIREANPQIKRAELVTESSRLHDLEAQIEDDVSFNALTALAEAQVTSLVEENGLGRGVAGSNSGSPTPAYSADNAIAPLDRVIASGDEEGNADDINGNPLTDGDLDVYGFDRSSGEFESFVDFNSTDRTLTEDLMDTFLAEYESFGTARREDMVIVTGHDTATELSQLQEDSGTFRFDISPDVGREEVNDAETRMGVPGVFEFRGYKGIPVVASQNIPAHGSISDIYVLDMSEGEAYGEGTPRPKAYIENYDSPYFEQAGRGQEQGYLATGTYSEQALFRHDHELVETDASAQAKLRDLQ